MRVKNVRPVVALFVFLGVTSTFAQSVNKSIFSGIAVEGYDVTSYFLDGRPVPGSRDFSYTWRGALWLFSTAAHRDLFAQDPEKFAPAYGGFCAYAVGNGYTAGIDPQAWSIVNGKLYLNYSPEVKQKWEQRRAFFIEQADRNWPGLSR